MSDGGGVDIRVSLGFSEKTAHDSKRSEMGDLLTTLLDNGLAGGDVEELLVIDSDGTITLS